MKTDSQLMADVQAELDWDPCFDHRGIVVAVKDGVVTLAGYVSSYVDVTDGIVTLTGEVRDWHEHDEAAEAGLVRSWRHTRSEHVFCPTVALQHN